MRAATTATVAPSPGIDARSRTIAAQAPTLVEDEANASLRILLRIEAEAREAKTVGELQFLIANETRKLTRARQIFVASRAASSTPRIEVISGLAAVDRSAPLVHGVTQAIAALGREFGLDKLREFSAAAYPSDAPELVRGYPFTALLWLPFVDRNGQCFAGMLLARDEPWIEADIIVAKRLAATYAHAWQALQQRSGWLPQLVFSRRVVAGSCAVAALLLAVPVSLTTLAPAEIVAKAPFVVTAPIDGIIDEVLVEPNAAVIEGQPLIRFVDIQVRNRLAIAERELHVAETRVKKATQQAFTDVRGRHDLGVAMADFELKSAERDFARDTLQRSEVKAQRAGIAVFADKKTLAGRPASVGERIMLIADPKAVEIQVDMSVGDAITLGAGSRVKVFLDADPLNAREAVVELADYQARVRPGNILGFKVMARLTGSEPLPRLGARGTAQLYGDSVALAFYLFRRPLSALRQWSGL